MPAHARLVIIGAGIVGCSTAYYLAQYGYKDVLVIDKGELFENDGSTSHAPGGINPISNNRTMAQFAADAIDLFETLPPWQPGRKPLRMVGGIDVARTAERMDEIRRLHSNAQSMGVESAIIGSAEMARLFPLLNTNPFIGGLYTRRKPTIAGAHVCGSLAREAQKMGDVRFVSHTKAIDFVIENNRVTAVKTNNPDMATIACEQVLLCTNIWTPALTERLGVNIPLMAAEHQYLKSAPLTELAHVSDHNCADHELIYPTVRDLDGGLYYRHWWDSIGVGSYHHRPIMVDSRKLGTAAEHPFTPEDFVDARPIAEETFPVLRGVEYPYKINGMFAFSVDGMPILGETSVGGFWVAAAVWVTNSGGVGKAMAQWLTAGEPELDMRDVNVNRFLPHQTTQRFIQLSCAKSYAEVHDVIHPAQWSSKPRDIRHTPFHQRHRELDAVFSPTAGLEMPLWLEANHRLLEAYDAQIPLRTGWSAQYWSRIQGAEHLAMRDAVGLFDLTSLSIIEVAGRDACEFVNYVCTNQMDIPAGRVTYTLLCTPNGGIKRDLAVARLADDRYWFFTGNGTLPQEVDWLQRLAATHPAAQPITIRDHSQNYAALGLFGPNARGVLEQVTPNDVSNDAFPFYTWQTIEVGAAIVYAMRISYVGELGWELHMPMDVALAVRDELWEAGRDFGLVSCGVGAMRSMRLEKGYRLWGGDIDTTHNPYEAGMGWLVKLKKGDFVGRDALVELKKQEPTRRLVTLTLDDPNAVVTGNEPIFVASLNGNRSNGHCIGQITSGNFGYSVGKYVALGYVPPANAEPGTQLEVEYLAERFPAVVAEDVLFDPRNERMKA